MSIKVANRSEPHSEMSEGKEISLHKDSRKRGILLKITVMKRKKKG